ncbi:MAG: ribonuclease HII [Bacteroidia bacterium]
MSLLLQYGDSKREAGIDEAGRGCLAGAVVAAAVILPSDFHSKVLNDSKQLSHKKRNELKTDILENALAWKVAFIDAPTIDKVNILQATYQAMHKAVAGLEIVPEFLVIDGNRFLPYPTIPHICIVKGDGKYMNIAAASILAKTFRDEYMEQLHAEFPMYDWAKNKGYPTEAHKTALEKHGLTPYHRKTFRWQKPLTLFDM